MPDGLHTVPPVLFRLRQLPAMVSVVHCQSIAVQSAFVHGQPLRGAVSGVDVIWTFATQRLDRREARPDQMLRHFDPDPRDIR